MAGAPEPGDPSGVIIVGGAHARVAHSTVQVSAEWRALFNFVTIHKMIRRRYDEDTKDAGEDTEDTKIPKIMKIWRLLLYDKMQKIREDTVIHHYQIR